jgi:hypothetical protein
VSGSLPRMTVLVMVVKNVLVMALRTAIPSAADWLAVANIQ